MHWNLILLLDQQVTAGKANRRLDARNDGDARAEDKDEEEHHGQPQQNIGGDVLRTSHVGKLYTVNNISNEIKHSKQVKFNKY